MSGGVMSEEHDSKISDLYQTSSQETPPAHIDQAVLSMARKSVPRRAFSPFGNQWVAGGAMVGVAVLSLLLIIAVPPQPDTYAPEDDAARYLSEQLPERQREDEQGKALKSEVFDRMDAESEEPAAAYLSEQLPKEQREYEQRPTLKSEKIDRMAAESEEPAAPKPRFDFYKILPETEVVIPEEEVQMQLQQAPAAKESARIASALTAEAIYLQVDSFRDKTHAEVVKTELVALGFKCEIQKVGTNNTNVYYRVRVGPFTDYVALDKSRKKLRELGYETQVVKKQE
jgi:cell division protein FtsN